MRKYLIAAALLAGSGQAMAQSTTCMDMGSGMAHCTTIGQSGMSTTDCMQHGQIVSCNTIGAQNQLPQTNTDSGAILGKGLVDLFRSFSERSLRREIGELLAAGNCDGAAALAFEKGQIELGQGILNSCYTQVRAQPVAPPSNLPYEELSALVSRAATAIPDNYDLGEGVYAVSVEPDGGTLVVQSNLTSESNPEAIQRIVCNNRAMQSVMVRGATVSLLFEANEARIDRTDCGI